MAAIDTPSPREWRVVGEDRSTPITVIGVDELAALREEVERLRALLALFIRDHDTTLFNDEACYVSVYDFEKVLAALEGEE